MIDTASRVGDARRAVPSLPSSKRLVLVCGKGGVGKTTVACAMALSWARAGQRVLLAGIHSTDQISRYFGVPTVDLREIELEPRLYAIHFDEQLIFNSFIKKTFRFKSLYRRILDSPVYQYFTAAAPGIKELMVLDTVQEIVHRPRPHYDHIIIDCPATGHGVSYFDVGRQAIRSFPVGPLRRKGEAIQKMLQDQTLTGILLVTLAEEMPVNETIELYQSVRSRLQIGIDGVVVNAMFPQPSHALAPEALERLREAAPTLAAPDLAKRLAAAGSFYSSRSQINHHHMQRLRAELPVPQVHVPFLPNEAKDLDFLLEVGRHLSGEGAARP